ncbi:hypothetical protein Trydic_g15275 [Trypoxylus dichotomus]
MERTRIRTARICAIPQPLDIQLARKDLSSNFSKSEPQTAVKPFRKIQFTNLMERKAIHIHLNTEIYGIRKDFTIPCDRYHTDQKVRRPEQISSKPESGIKGFVIGSDGRYAEFASNSC